MQETAMHTLNDSINTSEKGGIYCGESEQLDYDLPLVRELFA